MGLKNVEISFTFKQPVSKMPSQTFELAFALLVVCLFIYLFDFFMCFLRPFLPSRLEEVRVRKHTREGTRKV